MQSSHPVAGTPSRFWRRFDRWALGIVVVLQAVLWVGRRVERCASDGPRRTPEAPPAVERDAARADGAQTRPAATPRATAINASPVCLGGGSRLRAPASVESACSVTAWEVLRRSPALDVRELADGYELRLSVPGGCGDARAWVQDREVEIEVSLLDVAGQPSGRLVRQVLLPSALSTDAPPRIDHTNGILRVFLAKPQP